jgi:probable DNA repair protein
MAADEATPVGFHGFAVRSPARQALCESLERAGRRVSELALAHAPTAPTPVAAPTADAECEAIAAWLAERLRQLPDARLIVLLPDLAARAASLARLLDDRLAPSLLAPGAPDARPYAFGVAPSLAAQPVVDTALGLLELGAESVDVLAFGRLLRSPYLPEGPAGVRRRSRLDAALRAEGVRALPLAELPRRLRAMSPAEPLVATLIEAVRTELEPARARGPAEWADAFQRALRVAGWPKGRTLGGLEYEAARALTDALASLAGLATLLPVLSFERARAELVALVAATALHAEKGDPSVLVLEGLEDPALPCSGLWVAGLTADRFPGTATPTPFLPLALQRARGMPRATPAAALAGAREALAGWRRAAPELVLSAPGQAGEARLVRSALVPAATATLAPPALASRAAQLRAASVLEPWTEAGLPAVTGPHLHGGVRVLELQSLCPFRAGAELRLGARALELPTVGVPPRVRGDLAHLALREFWASVVSQDALCALDDVARRVEVRAAVERAVRAYRRRLPAGRLLELECDWLVEALDRLARLEGERESFEVVGREVPGQVVLGEWSLSIRLDRVDRLADGTEVLIDYKTGRATPRRWIGPRPDAMQLATYALSRQAPPTAVALALLPLTQTGFAGLAERGGVLPKVAALADARAPELRALDWSSLLASWRELATGLARDHVAGLAQVDPAPRACDQCQLGTLCRIGTPDVEGDESEEGGDE